jgi:hydroxymethylpyrimidine pyrophosphatase-like HAD family hydrolase
MNETGAQRQRPIVLVTDIDGTFVDESATPSHGTLIAAKAILQAGIQLIFATGRRPSSAQVVLGDLLNSAALVSLDGAVGHFKKYRLSYIETLSPNASFELRMLSALLEQASARIIIGTPLDCVVAASWWDNRSIPTPQGRMSLKEFFDCREDFSILRIELRRSVTAARIIRSLAVNRWNATCLPRDAWWFLVPKNTGKEIGVHRVLDQGGPAPLILAVGDGHNDLGLLRAADIPITIKGSIAATAIPLARRIDQPSEGGWSQIPRLVEKIYAFELSQGATRARATPADHDAGTHQQPKDL